MKPLINIRKHILTSALSPREALSPLWEHVRYEAGISLWVHPQKQHTQKHMQHSARIAETFPWHKKVGETH